MRNMPYGLNAAEVLRANTARAILSKMVDSEVCINYRKRDGSPRIIRGRVVEIVGAGDKEIVKVQTKEGFKSANLWNIFEVMP